MEQEEEEEEDPMIDVEPMDIGELPLSSIPSSSGDATHSIDTIGTPNEP